MKNKRFNYLILFALIGVTMSLKGQNTQLPSPEQSSEFKPSGKVWGLTFFDYYTKVHADSLNRGNTQYADMKNGANAFDFRRIYLGYDFQISRSFSTQVLLAHESNTDAQGNRTVFIKAANVRWKNIIKNNDLIIGQTATPIYALMSEQVWGYRSIEKTIVDQRKLGSSSDVGLTWIGKVGDEGNFGYNFMVGNGTAQKPENDKYKKIYGEVYAKFFHQKFIVDFTSDYEVASGTQSRNTYKGFIAYQSDPVTAGLEVFTQVQKGATTDTTEGFINATNVNVVPFGISAFIHGQIVPQKLNYFARYDFYSPDTKFNADLKYATNVPDYKENFVVAGLDWMPVNNVHFMPNVWFDSYSSMKNNVSGKAKFDYDLVPRVTFYYVFNK